MFYIAAIGSIADENSMYIDLGCREAPVKKGWVELMADVEDRTANPADSPKTIRSDGPICR